VAEHAKVVHGNAKPAVATTAVEPALAEGDPYHELLNNRPEIKAREETRRMLNARPALVAQRAAVERLSRRRATGPQPTPSAGSAPEAGNRTGLPDRLKSGVERLSGLSMDDVRVHRNSGEPARLGALAFAKGGEIHLGPGQERHLPHEAWHVVQQKQGRVKPNLQMKGIPLNDDEGLEAEADRMGERASGLGSLEPATPTAPAASARPVVQRMIGFEFESGNAIKEAEDPKKDLAKDRVYTGEGFHIDADTKNKNGNNIEFVTDPVADAEAAEAVIATMVEFAGALDSGPRPEGDGWAADYVLTISDDTWDATMQHTEGVLLADMATFLRFHLDNDEDHKHDAAMAAIDQRHVALALDDSVKGLIHHVLHYLRVLKVWDGKNNDEGPKNAGTIMSRTDFHSAFLSLDDAAQAQFQGRIAAELQAGGFAVGDMLIPKPYLQYEPGVEKPKLKANETTIGEWLQSIYAGIELEDDEHLDKDLLSPPEGYGVFEPTYSMGAMEMDGDLVVIEVRQHGNFSNLTRDLWGTAPALAIRED
jgi:hypothetical protein